MKEIDLARTSEQENCSERYRMVMAGGRVKSAGASLKFLYDAALPLIENPTDMNAAFQASKKFARLKEKPPIEIRMAFFPQDESSMRTAFKGSGIYRPTIKTDQGPGGNVGYFHIVTANESQVNGKIIKEEGVAVVEEFLRRRFNGADLSELQQKEVSALIGGVQKYYLSGSYREAFEVIQGLREKSLEVGIETTRKAGVGRGEFFFFRPIEMQDKLIIGKDLTDAISLKTQEIIDKIERLARLTKQYVRQGLSIQDAMVRAEKTKEDIYFGDREKGLLYFQSDVLLRNDGSFDIEKINMPDLGMFLTQIDFPNNGSLHEIQKINGVIKKEILDTVANSIGQDVVFITRDEVLDNCEDTLEQLEIATFGEGLRVKGKSVRVRSLKSVRDLPSGSSIILFNVDSQNSDFENLLYRVAAGEIQCFPNPFIKLFEKDATTFARRKIKGQVLDKFLKIITPSALDKPEGVYSKYVSINNALKLGGINEDIIYFSVNGNSIIPAFRYDVKSFSEVYKAVENARKRDEDVSEIIAIPVPFKPNDAVIEGKDGPRLAVFRFAFVKN